MTGKDWFCKVWHSWFWMLVIMTKMHRNKMMFLQQTQLWTVSCAPVMRKMCFNTAVSVCDVEKSEDPTFLMLFPMVVLLSDKVKEPRIILDSLVTKKRNVLGSGRGITQTKSRKCCSWKEIQYINCRFHKDVSLPLTYTISCFREKNQWQSNL